MHPISPSSVAFSSSALLSHPGIRGTPRARRRTRLGLLLFHPYFCRCRCRYLPASQTNPHQPASPPVRWRVPFLPPQAENQLALLPLSASSATCLDHKNRAYVAGNREASEWEIWRCEISQLGLTIFFML